jgi:anaerobic dimethyl sulfoxide reductase subunit A
VTENVRPGVIGIGQGAWIQWNDELGLDMGGNANILCGAIRTGQGHQGWNSCNVDVVKWTGSPVTREFDMKIDLPVFTASPKAKGDKK